jgi:hypothetical protein
MVLARKKRMELPEYFDSQAQAAAMLNMSIYDIKAAKARGCPAFRGGRIRRREFEIWWKEKFEPAPTSETSDDEEDDWPRIYNVVGWPYKACRREMLFSLIEYIEKALKDDQITGEGFCAMGEKTIPLVIELGRIWGAPITEKQQARLEKKLTRVQEKLSRKSRTPDSPESGASEPARSALPNGVEHPDE